MKWLLTDGIIGVVKINPVLLRNEKALPGKPETVRNVGFAITALLTARCMLCTTNEYSEDVRGPNVARQLPCSLSRVLTMATL